VRRAPDLQSSLQAGCSEEARTICRPMARDRAGLRGCLERRVGELSPRCRAQLETLPVKGSAWKGGKLEGAEAKKGGTPAGSDGAGKARTGERAPAVEPGIRRLEGDGAGETRR
jgi:hypothetical protein